MRDIGVMTYQEIKKEPISPDSHHGHCCQNYDQDAVVGLTDYHYINNVKEEKTIPCDEEIPNDQEIIDLVDSMSQDSDTSSNASGSSYDEYDGEVNNEEQHLNRSPLSNDPRSKSLTILKPSIHTEDYLFMYDYQSTAQAPPPLTPESASEILKGITNNESS
ncbi:uncharacterized protein LOC110250519 [Exaiptasia diaphana]|uniref:Uncharacterized protein n=1 Tax=Exaiptasia diaphana TaxID=2652724 RepID=A0A913Y0G4_EXADI|nr:uncharacterized protein LOC110250519 [Exaiptasia diaphana]